MKLNPAEKWVVNNPVRAFGQWIEIQWFKKAMPMRQGAKVLEVGCGRGAGGRLIWNEFQPSELLCQDLDIQMIQKAKKYLSLGKLENIDLQVGDTTELPYKDHTMDAVFDFGALHHVPNWRKAVTEIYRVLKPGGNFYFEELYPSLYQNAVTKHLLVHPREDRFSGRDLQTALVEAGLYLKASVENRLLGILGAAISGNGA